MLSLLNYPHQFSGRKRNNIHAGRAGIMSGRQSALSGDVVSLPQNFGWTPDFSITGGGLGGYAASYNPLSDKPSGTTLWVDNTNGNDTTGDGSEGSPYRTIAKAVTENAVVVNIKTGDYWRNDSWAAQLDPTSDIAFVAVDGAGTVRLGRIEDFSDLPSWSDEGSNTWSTTRSNTNTVLDTTETGHASKTLVDGVTPVPLPMTEVSDLAAVQAHSGHAWAQVGTTLYVKTHDLREPDSDVLPIITERNMRVVNRDITLYLEGIEIWGDRPAYFDMSTSNTARFVAYNCGFRFSSENDNVYFDGVNHTRLIDCKISHNLVSDDGINYDRNSGSAPETFGLEVNCESFANGDSTNDNGSTTHDPSVYVIRLNGDYGDNPGPGIVDSSGARAVNLGCKSNDGFIGIQVGTYSGDTPAIQWNKDCQATGNSSFGRDRSTGGLQFDLGGNDFQNGKSTGRSYVDSVAHPELETILTTAPDSIIGLYCVLDTDMYCQILSDEVDDFFDVSANKSIATKIRTGVRAAYSATQINSVAGWSTSDSASDDDTAYTISKAMDVYGVSMIGMYGDGTDTTFSGFHCLLTGTTTDTPRIMGSNGNNALHATGDFAGGFSRDGGAEDASPLPMPLDFYDAVSDTAAVQSSTYTILGSNTYTDGRAWYGDNMGMVIIRNRAWTTAEELAIRTAAKDLFGIS